MSKQSKLSSTPAISPNPKQKPAPSIWFIILFSFFGRSMRKQLEGSKFCASLFFYFLYSMWPCHQSMFIWKGGVINGLYLHCGCVTSCWCVWVEISSCMGCWALIDSTVWMSGLGKGLLEHCRKFVEDLLGLYGFCSFGISCWIFSWIVVGFCFFSHCYVLRCMWYMFFFIISN